MITEDYVSFETAKLLKEKGFDGQCLSKYNSNGCIWDNIRYDGMLLGNNDIFPQEYLAPTLQMAMKWLREEKHIPVEILWRYDVDSDMEEWYFIHHVELRILPYNIEYYETYEEACEAAIKYCLENLV